MPNQYSKNTRLYSNGYCHKCQKKVKMFKVHYMYHPHWQYKCLVCNPELAKQA